MKLHNKKVRDELIKKGIASEHLDECAFLRISVGTNDPQTVETDVKQVAQALGVVGIERAVLRNYKGEGTRFVIGYNLMVPQMANAAIAQVWEYLSDSRLTSIQRARLLSIVKDLRRRATSGEDLLLSLDDDDSDLNKILLDLQQRGMGVVQLMTLFLAVLSFVSSSKHETITINNITISIPHITATTTKQSKSKQRKAKPKKSKKSASPSKTRTTKP